MDHIPWGKTWGYLVVRLSIVRFLIAYRVVTGDPEFGYASLCENSARIETSWLLNEPLCECCRLSSRMLATTQGKVFLDHGFGFVWWCWRLRALFGRVGSKKQKVEEEYMWASPHKYDLAEKVSDPEWWMVTNVERKGAWVAHLPQHCRPDHCWWLFSWTIFVLFSTKRTVSCHWVFPRRMHLLVLISVL